MRTLVLIAAVLIATGPVRAEPVTLLDGKLKFDTTDAFVPDKKPTSTKESIADFSARNSDGWGAITRGTHGLQPEELKNYMSRKVDSYTKGL